MAQVPKQLSRCKGVSRGLEKTRKDSTNGFRNNHTQKKTCATFQQPSLCLEEKAPPDVQQAFQESRKNPASQADDIVESLYHDTCLAQSSDRFHRLHKAALIRVPGSDHPHQGTKFLSGRLDAERCYFACACACACIKTPQRVCTLDQLQTPSPC